MKLLIAHPALRVLWLVSIAVITGYNAGWTQVDAQFSQYYAVPSYYNPAATGLTEFLNVRAGSRLQWVGMPGAPKTFAAVAEMPVPVLSRRLGVGVSLQQESIGLYRNISGGAQVSYKITLLGGELSAGLQLGLINEVFKGSEVILPDDTDGGGGADDAIPSTDVSGSSFDLGLGVYYSHPRFWAGLSMSHVNRPVVTMTADDKADTEYRFEAGRVLYFMAGGNIPVKGTLIEIQPSLLVKSDFTFTTGEITARARYNRLFTFGLAYRHDDAVSFLLGAEYRNFYVGYSYDYAVSEISKASNGSHEIWAGYSVKLNFNRGVKHRHKSIRIM